METVTNDCAAAVTNVGNHHVPTTGCSSDIADKKRLTAALYAIPVAQTSYEQWLTAGMALKNEGFPCDVWEEWSKSDTRYRPGVCEKKWASFGHAARPVTGATLVHMARLFGWQGEDNPPAKVPRVVGTAVPPAQPAPAPTPAQATASTPQPAPANAQASTPQPAQGGAAEMSEGVCDLIRYLELLFAPDERVSFVTAACQDKDGKWKPGSAGRADRTAGELIASLKEHPDDIRATVGSGNPLAGAWIRFNPTDGNGAKNENVTRFTYALVESDTLPIREQDELLRGFNLPIRAEVYSGNKSVHAIVRVDAKDAAEYAERVSFLYDWLTAHGFPVDKANRNPSRLSRMPGVYRDGGLQRLVGENLGAESWDAWMATLKTENDLDEDGFPAIIHPAAFNGDLPELPPELISGILRKGHKMLIAGPSKAGKSYLLLELCVAIAEGQPWLGFGCAQGKVLYINLEIDGASFIHRLYDIYAALGILAGHMDNIDIFNLRGRAEPLDRLVPVIIDRVKEGGYTAVIIDPIYKIITGDENSATDMGAFCNQFDRIADATGAAVIYCHHHSKGAQGAKRAMDRSSGSGVFARDPDAVLDITPLELTEHIKNFVRDGDNTAWRLEGNLREFKSFKPVDFWFEHPIHRLDTSGELKKTFAEGSYEAGRAKNKCVNTAEERLQEMETAYDVCNSNGYVLIKDMAQHLHVTESCIRSRLRALKDVFNCKQSKIWKVGEPAPSIE